MPKTRRTGYRNVVRHRPRAVHTVAGSTCIHTLPLIRLKARRGFGGARTPSSHTRQATLHNTAHNFRGRAMQLLAWALITPIYLTARTITSITKRLEAAAIREAAWANAVAAEETSAHGESH